MAYMLVVWQGQGHDGGSVGMQQFIANAIHKRLEVSRGGRVFLQEVFVETKGEKYQHGLTLLECKASDILVRETRTQRHGLMNECVLRPVHTIESVLGARSILLASVCCVYVRIYLGEKVKGYRSYTYSYPFIYYFTQGRARRPWGLQHPGKTYLK